MSSIFPIPPAGIDGADGAVAGSTCGISTPVTVAFPIAGAAIGLLPSEGPIDKPAPIAGAAGATGGICPITGAAGAG